MNKIRTELGPHVTQNFHYYFLVKPVQPLFKSLFVRTRRGSSYVQFVSLVHPIASISVGIP